MGEEDQSQDFGNGTAVASKGDASEVEGTTQDFGSGAAVARKANALDVEGSPEPVDDDGKPRRTGNVWTASAHIITAVIGSGVLALAWSFAQMGWIAGPIILLLFAWCTYYTSALLTDCYRSPDSVTGKRNYIYMDAVKANLSSRAYWLCGLVQYSNLVGTSIGYTIAAATSAQAIQKDDCFHKLGANGHCVATTTVYIGLYGLVQVVLSQIPNFGELWWLSYVAAVMSFAYSCIGMGLGISKAAEGEPGHDYGSITGVKIGIITRPQKVWNIFTSLGNMAFAYSFSMILIEIQDTLRNPPPENKQMKAAARIGISVTTFFYMSVAIAGYAAFGNNAPGNLLTGFLTPYWLIDFANTCVVIHLVGAYQVYTQPVFQFVEMFIGKRYPKSSFLHKGYTLRFPGVRPFRLNLFHMLWRTAYVVITTVIAMVIPFFNDVLGILGALGFWPLTVQFPVAMYIAQHKTPRWSKKWIQLYALSLITLIVSLLGLLGSVEGILQDLKHVTLFKAS